MKKAFITGANGFLGRHLVNFLKKKNITSFSQNQKNAI